MVETRPDAGSARAVQVLWLWYVILVTSTEAASLFLTW